MPTPTQQITRQINQQIDPAVYTHNIHAAITHFHQAGSPPQSLPRLGHVVQANYDTLNRAGYFRQGQGQQIGHLLRDQGYAHDPTQGGATDPNGSAPHADPYGSPAVPFPAPPAPRPGVPRPVAVPRVAPAPAQARQAAAAPLPQWRRTMDNTFGTGNHEGDIHKAAQAVIPGVKAGYHALDQWSQGLGEKLLSVTGGTTTVQDLPPAQHAANARRLLAQAKQGGLALVPGTVKDIAAGMPARTIAGNIVRVGRDHPFNFVLNSLPFAEWGALSALGKAAKLDSLATAVEASGDAAQAARMRAQAATLRRGAQPVHDVVTAKPLRQAVGQGLRQGMKLGVGALRRQPLGRGPGADDMPPTQPVGSKGGSLRPSTTPSRTADAKLAQQIEPGWQKLNPAKHLLDTPTGQARLPGDAGAEEEASASGTVPPSIKAYADTEKSLHKTSWNELQRQYGEVRVPVPDKTFERVGAPKGNVFADYIQLQRKHADEFSHPQDVKEHVEYVSANPTYILPGSKEGYSLLVRKNDGLKATVVEFQLRGGKYRVRSAYKITEASLNAKLKQNTQN